MRRGIVLFDSSRCIVERAKIPATIADVAVAAQLIHIPRQLEIDSNAAAVLQQHAKICARRGEVAEASLFEGSYSAGRVFRYAKAVVVLNAS